MAFGTRQLKNLDDVGDVEVSSNPVIKKILDGIKNANSIKEIRNGLKDLYQGASDLCAKDNSNKKLLDYAKRVYQESTDIIDGGVKKGLTEAVMLDNVKKNIASVDNEFWQPVSTPSQKSKEDGFSLRIESEYSERMQKIKQTFSMLENYSGMDDLAGLIAIDNVLNGQIADLRKFLSENGGDSRDPVKQDKARKQENNMQTDLTEMAKNSPYFSRSVKDGKFDKDELYIAITTLINTVSSMNAIDSKINIFTQSGKANLPNVARDPASGAKIEDFQKIGIVLSGSDLVTINAMLDGATIDINVASVKYTMTRAGNSIQISRGTTLSPDEKADIQIKIGDLKDHQAALDYICAMRYGATGEGFDPAYLALGITPRANSSVGDRYTALANEILDSYKKVGEYASKTALMFPRAYSVLVSSKVDVKRADSLVETRDAFDPFSRLAMFRTVQDGGIPGSISDNLLSQMVLRASYMPVSTAGLLLGSESFFYTLALMPDDGLRQAVFNQAAMLISNMYANTTNANGMHQNYTNAGRLMKKFETLGASGTLVSSIDTKYFYGLERGHIGIKTPGQDIRFERMYDMSTLESFARSTLQPTSLTWNAYTPEVVPGSRYTPTSAKYIFDQAHGEKLRYLKTMPSARSLTVDYSPNSLDMQASYGMIIGKMSDAYNAILKEKITKLRVSSASGAIQGSGTSRGGSGTSWDEQVWMQGYVPGQNMYLESFQKWSTEEGSKYAPGQFSKFDQSKSTEIFVNSQANQMNILGTNVWQSFLTYTQNKQTNITDDGGNPATIGGLTDEQMNRQINASINSTFPLSRNGTMLVNITETKNAENPVATATGAGKETTERYDIDIYVKKGETWDHTILKGRSREYMESMANGTQTLGDAVHEYFTQLYSELGKRTTVDAAVEVGKQKYDWDKSKTGIGTDNRLGVMLIIQPGINAAVAGGMTTTGDKVVAGAIQDKSNVVYGGFYSLSDLDIATPTTGNSGSGLYPFGMNNYYMPTYELDEKQPKSTKGRVYVGDVTWLALQNFRASLFGGWKTSERGVIAGEDLRLKNANISSFMSFDSTGHILNGIVSAGGKTERVFGMDNVNLRGHIYALQAKGGLLFSSDPTLSAFKDRLDAYGLQSSVLTSEDAAAIGSMHNDGDVRRIKLDGKKYLVMMKEGRLNMYSDNPQELGAAVSYRVGKGTMTITCNLRPEQWGNATIDDITLRRIVDNSQSIVDYVSKIPAETLLDLKLREPVMREVRDRVRQVVAEAIMLNPTNDLYKSFLNNVSVGYRDANVDWAVTASTTDDARTFLTGMFNFKDKVGIIGGWKPAGSLKPEGVDWLAGGKASLGKGNTAFSIYVSETKDKRILANADFANIKIGAAAASVGKDYYCIHVLAGPVPLSGIVNIVSVGTTGGTLKSQEYGLRAALWAPVFLTAIYSHTQMPGMNSDLLQNALYATANQYGLFPEKINMDSFQADLYFKTGKHSSFSVTGQMFKFRGKEMPWDFYVAGKFIWNP
ncbi:MAG: hypothetical protein NTX79_08695 [Candidatus Micrarchaeota archaeon]|nr:hypothetical protein [Candidatus Micrarchaeota archaeon]